MASDVSKRPRHSQAGTTLLQTGHCRPDHGTLGLYRGYFIGAGQYHGLWCQQEAASHSGRGLHNKEDRRVKTRQWDSCNL